MILDTQYRKVRSISEGNFHSCYASNKAEKFKFRRLSQGLESCAQAQALKLRKEEKSLRKILDHLNNEKEKHLHARESNKVYLKQQNFEASSSQQHVSFHESIERERSHIPLQNGTSRFSTPGSEHTISEEKRHERRDILREKFACDYHEVTPFYLQHGYTQYHHDTFYDHLIEQTKGSTTNVHQHDENEPSWTKTTPLALCKRRHTLPANSQFPSLDNNGIAKCNSGVLSRVGSISPPETPLINEFGRMSPISIIPQVGSSINTIPSIGVIEKPMLENHSSVLTPFERQELAKHARRATSLSFNKSRSEQKVKAEKQRRSTIHVTPRALLMKSLIHNKLKEGKTIEELIEDPSFDEILEVCDDHRVYPAYDSGAEDQNSFSDFRALKNCKYLRLSDLNIRSLKQCALEELSSCCY